MKFRISVLGAIALFHSSTSGVEYLFQYLSQYEQENQINSSASTSWSSIIHAQSRSLCEINLRRPPQISNFCRRKFHPSLSIHQRGSLISRKLLIMVGSLFSPPQFQNRSSRRTAPLKKHHTTSRSLHLPQPNYEPRHSTRYQSSNSTQQRLVLPLLQQGHPKDTHTYRDLF